MRQAPRKSEMNIFRTAQKVSGSLSCVQLMQEANVKEALPKVNSCLKSDFAILKII